MHRSVPGKQIQARYRIPGRVSEDQKEARVGKSCCIPASLANPGLRS
jgi:hypothetical protein